jgi:hypothetical protein
MSESTKNTNKNNFDLIEEDEICREVMLEHPDLFYELDWDEFNLKEKLEKNPYLYQQYRMLWLSQRHKLKKVEILMEEYIGKLYDELRYGGEKSLTKTEIERYYVPKDETVMKFRRAYMRQEIRTEIYEHIANSFKMQGMALSAYVKAMQL